MQSLRLFLSAAFSSPVFGPLNSSCRGLFILSATSLQFRKTAGFCLFPLVSLVCFLFVRDYCSLFSNICCCCCKVASVVSNSVQPHRRQPTRLPRTWDSPGKNTRVGCQFLLQCMKVKSEKWKGSRSVESDSSRPHRLQPTRLLHPWDFPGNSTGVGCHCLLCSNILVPWKLLFDVFCIGILLLLRQKSKSYPFNKILTGSKSLDQNF